MRKRTIPRKTEDGFYHVPGLAHKSALYMLPMERAFMRGVRAILARNPQKPWAIDLAADTLSTLYSTKPRVKDESHISIERSVNGQLLEWAQSMTNWGKTHMRTSANLPAAQSAATLMWENLMDEETLRAIMARQEEIDQRIDQAEDLERQGVWYQQNGQSSRGDESFDKAKKLRQQAQEIADQAKKEMDKAKKNPMMRAAVAIAVKEAQEKADEVAEAQAQFGWGTDAGDWEDVDINKVLAFMSKNSKKLAQIAEIIGRARNIAVGMSNKKSVMTHAITRAAHTKDLMRTFPAELASLSPDAPPVLRAHTAAQWSSQGLLGWDNVSEMKKKGAFVAMIDGSGSMSGEREIVAKGTALGVSQAALADNRYFRLNTFGSRYDKMDRVSSDEGWEKIVEWAAKMPSGGTDFDTAMGDLIEQVLDAHKHGMEDIDGLFVSDGEAIMKDETIEMWKKAKEKTGARLLYVSVASGYGQMEKLADKVIELHELDNKAGDEIARTLGGWFGDE